MAKLNTPDLLGQFKDMTLVELTEFVKAFETEFDVTAAAPVAAAAAGAQPVAQQMLPKMSSQSSLRMLVLRRLQLSKRYVHLTPALA